jgi:hypothetical protein
MEKPNQKLFGGKFLRLIIVLTGIILFQSILYGPSLIGRKVLLPLDILTQPGWQIPASPETEKITPQDMALVDLIEQFEPARRFAVSEIQKGRFPLWAPYQYAGVPYVWPKFSPFLLLEYTTQSPIILAWAQLLAALVTGMGMYFFCRQMLHVSFWPATICAWCYPLTAFFILWQGYPTRLPVCWLPWIFLFADKTIRSANYRAVIGLSLATGLVLISGNIDVAGQVLLGCGLYAIWGLWDAHQGQWLGRKMKKAIALLVLGWGLGFMLAAPHLLPLLEYAQTGSRMVHRSQGMEERPPVGLAALPQVVLPNMYGTTAKGSYFIGPGEPNLPESPSATYVGIFAALLVAPLAWLSNYHRRINLFWALLAFFGLSWCLDVPVLVDMLRLPGLNMMSHNRLVFLTAFSIFALTAIGLENLWQGVVVRQWWFWLPAALLVGLGIWSGYHSMYLPEPVATKLEFALAGGTDAGVDLNFSSIRDLEGVRQVQGWYARHYALTAMFCGIGFAGWAWLWFKKCGHFYLFLVVAVLLPCDLLWFDYGRSAQSDPALYYPKIPILDEIATSVPGRVVGVGCLFPTLPVMQGLNDIKGYDAIDPARMIDLVKLAAEPSDTHSYGALQIFIPKGELIPPDSISLSPILDMLGVRYVVFRGSPAAHFHPLFQGDDYWVMINSNALPRVFIPRSVELVASDNEELAKLASPQYNSAKVTYLQSPVELPPLCRGMAQITNETPTHITVSVQMETPGLVVLADRWDNGWRAFWNHKPVNILQANYAVCGVVLPSGAGTLEFIYKPVSLILGFYLAGLAICTLLFLGIIRKCFRDR